MSFSANRLLLLGNKNQDQSPRIASAFAARVLADGGVSESQLCLQNTIRTLTNLGFYNQASLILTPNGYKSSKLYSLLPTNGSGDFAFTRNGVKLRQGPSLLESLAIHVPSIDHTINGCPTLSLDIIESNLMLQSETYDNGSWVKGNTTVSADATPGPDNASTADNIFETTTNGVHNVGQVFTKAGSAITYSYSVYVKPNGREWVFLQCFNGVHGYGQYFQLTGDGVKGNSELAGGGFSFVNAIITKSGNGFYRCTLILTTDATTNLTARTYIALDGTSSRIYAGDITKGVSLGGSQLEESSLPTSYIVTTTAAASRVADAVTGLTNVSGLIGQTEGTVFFQGRTFTDGINKFISLSDGTTNNRLSVIWDSLNRIRSSVLVEGVAVADVINGGFISSVNYKVAVIYRANYFALVVNGGLVGEDLSVSYPAFSQIRFSNADGSLPFYGRCDVFGISKNAMPVSQALALTV